MSLGDTIIAGYESTVEDEYQASILHRANTISFHLATYGFLALGAALAWLVPNELFWVSLLVIVPMLVSALVGMSWMRRRAPRPTVHMPGPVGWALIIFIAFAWIAGLQYNAPDTDTSTAVGGLVGGVIGGAIGYFVVAWTQKRGRRNDIRRLDAEYAED